MITNKQLSNKLKELDKILLKKYSRKSKRERKKKKRDWRTYEEQYSERIKKCMKELELLLKETSYNIRTTNKRGKKFQLTVKQKTTLLLIKHFMGKTKLSIIYESASDKAKEAIEKSGMNEGWNSSLDKLQDLVERGGNMIKLNPYLIFGGKCAEAMEYYQSIFGGELKMQKYSEIGMPVSDEDKDKIIHAHLENSNITLMASDDNAKSPVKVGNNVQLSISGSDEAKLREIFNKLSQGGKIQMPLKKEFWGDIFGMLTDRFGMQWMVNISSGAKK